MIYEQSIHNKKELLDAVKQSEETGFPKLYNEVLFRMSYIDTSKIRELLSENIGEYISPHINELCTTANWIYHDASQIVAYEDAESNTLYIFNTTSYLLKFMHDNSWTYDAIVDFESRSMVQYEYDNDSQLKSTTYFVTELTQEDADILLMEIKYIVDGEKL